MHTPWYGLQIIQSIIQTYAVSPCSSSCLNFSSLLLWYSKGYPDTPGYLDPISDTEGNSVLLHWCRDVAKVIFEAHGGQLLREV